MHFPEIIKLQFRKKSHTLLYVLPLFRDIIVSLSLKNAWLPPIFVLDSKGLNKVCFSHIQYRANVS